MLSLPLDELGPFSTLRRLSGSAPPWRGSQRRLSGSKECGPPEPAAGVLTSAIDRPTEHH